MSKSRRRPVRRTAKSTTSRRKTTTRKTSRGPKVIRLKPLYEQLGRTIGQLERLPPSDRVKFAIARLTQCRAEFDEMCGPTMDIPVGVPIG